MNALALSMGELGATVMVYPPGWVTMPVAIFGLTDRSDIFSGAALTMILELKPDVAPNHVARIKELTRQGFYDGVVFHRVIPGFMAQTGDPTGTGSGGSDLDDLRSEFSNEKHKRGTVSAARTSDPHSANSQFFICFDNAPWSSLRRSGSSTIPRQRRAARLSLGLTWRSRLGVQADEPRTRSSILSLQRQS